MKMRQKTFTTTKNLLKRFLCNKQLGYIGYIYIFISIHTCLHSSDFLKQLVKTDSNQKFFIGVLEEKQKLLDEFRKEQTELTRNYKTASEKLARQIDEIQTFNIKVENELQKNTEDDFF